MVVERTDQRGAFSLKHSSPSVTSANTASPAMMSLRSSTAIILALALSNTAYSVPTASSELQKRADHPGYDHPTNGNCKDYSIKNTFTTDDYIWGYEKLKDNYDAAALLFNITSKDDAAGSFDPSTGLHENTAEYEIAGTFCSPKTLKGNGTEKTVLVATHGFGFDRRYWAPENEDYSFAKYVLDAGYSIFYYDRLGVGESQRYVLFSFGSTQHCRAVSLIQPHDQNFWL
jgi:hypothetical protein